MKEFLEVDESLYSKEIEMLEMFYERTGNCVMNGYVGSSLDGISYDEAGRMEFHSFYQEGDLKTVSTGALLRDSIVIKQIQLNKRQNYYQLFSWDKDLDTYTYLAFDDEKTLDYAYRQIKRYAHFLGEEAQQEIVQLGIPFEHIMDVKACQKFGEDAISSIFSDYNGQAKDSFRAPVSL